MSLTVKLDSPGRASLYRDGKLVGHVSKHSRRYNLARSFTVTWWSLSLPTHQLLTVTPSMEKIQYRTRREAVQAAENLLGVSA